MIAPAALEDVVAWLDSHASALPPETVATRDAIGRVLAHAVDAGGDCPATATAAADGYALLAENTVGASEYNPLTFRLRSAGGSSLMAGEARPVVNGEPLPEGMDAVLPLQDVEVKGEKLDVFAPLACGENVIAPGREAHAGDRLLDAGRVLRAADAALLMELGIEEIPAVRRPVVRIMAVRGPVRDTAGPMIRALAARDGGVCEQGGGATALESVENLAPALAACECDLIIVLGGSGLGPNDPAAEALSRAGDLAFRGVAINPGETSILGHVGGTLVVVLPGPPLASLFAYDVLAGRVLRRLGGREAGWPYATRRAVLARKIASGLGRLECCRVRLDGDSADPLAVADARTLSTAVRADGFVLVPSSSEGFAAGSEVIVHLYDQRF